MLSKVISVAGIALFVGLISASAHADTQNSYQFNPNLGTLQSITIKSTVTEGLRIINDNINNVSQSGTLYFGDENAAYLVVDGHYNHQSAYSIYVGELDLNPVFLSYDVAPNSEELFLFSQTFTRTLTPANLLPGNGPVLTAGNAEEIFSDIAAGQEFSFETNDEAGHAYSVNPISGGLPEPFLITHNYVNNSFSGVSGGGFDPYPIVTYTYLSAAPEPTVWSLMILGLGLCGAALRGGRGSLKGTRRSAALGS